MTQSNSIPMSTYNGTILARIVKGVLNKMLDNRYDTVKVDVDINLQWYNFDPNGATPSQSKPNADMWVET